MKNPRKAETLNVTRDVSFDDYMVESMKDPVQAAAYLDAVMEMGDSAALLLALRHVVKAHGMAEVARRADVGDKTLFKALSETGNPTLETVTKVLHVMGLRLSVVPLTIVTDCERVKRETAQDAPIAHTAADSPYDPNDAAAVVAYWQQANIANHNKEPHNETFPKPVP